MKKQTVLVMSPFETQSGYGNHSRDIIISLIKLNKYDIKLVPLTWGNCPHTGLDENNKYHNMMKDLVLTEQLREQPDIFIHITVPNEFQQIGKVNIGITAGIETDRVSPNWIESCNKMDLVLFPSSHSKNIHEKSKYQYKNNLGQVVKDLVNTTDLQILFEGVDTTIYKENDKNQQFGSEHPLYDLQSIPEDFCFLSVGQWQSNGKLREDRKDTAGVIYNFIKTFHYQKDKVGLILKVNGAGFSLLDKKSIINKIKDIRNKFPDIDKQPNIYLIHGNLTNNEMNDLYNLDKVKAMFSCTHGEGYGRPFAEFLCATKKPVYVTGWSGHTDFITNKQFHFKYTINKVPDSTVWKNIIEKDSNWAYVDDNDVENKLKHCYHNYDKELEMSKFLSDTIRNEKNLDKMTKIFGEILEDFKPPAQQNIILPGSIDISKLRKISEK